MTKKSLILCMATFVSFMFLIVSSQSSSVYARHVSSETIPFYQVAQCLEADLAFKNRQIPLREPQIPREPRVPREPQMPRMPQIEIANQ